MRKIDTNIMFFQQDNDNYSWNISMKYIESRYKTLVWLLKHSNSQRIEMAKFDNKKFGLVLKTIKP